MLGIVAFVVSIVAAIMSFYSQLTIPSFAVAILAAIIAVVSAWDKSTSSKDKKEETKGKESRALEVGSVVISAATSLSFFVFTFI
ncbi:MAG: hypothetical protein ACM67R_09290 [Clostridiales bacterium]|jgi:membrane protein implicated in regulation of membrane protease activity|nr:unknown [Clostridium sp. CAG:567]